MRRVAIGLVAGVAVWVGSALGAEAQSIQIQPIGPTAITPSSTSTIYKANITPGSTNVVDTQLTVYKNSEPTPRYTSAMNMYSIAGTLTYSARISLSGWGLVDGDTVRFHLACWWDPNGQLSSNDYTVTVTGS